MEYKDDEVVQTLTKTIHRVKKIYCKNKSPLVRELFKLKTIAGIKTKYLIENGFYVHAWQAGCDPSLTAFSNVANLIGYELRLVKIEQPPLTERK